MKVLEFHFNPRLKKEGVFETFCFAPETKFEERLGYLYLIGELKDIFRQNNNLLENIAEIIKKEYYQKREKSLENCLKDSLQLANEFLSKELKKENVDWLGKLNFAAISISNNFLVKISKIGSLKILLLRNGEIFNVENYAQINTFSENQEESSSDFESLNLNMFSGVIEGRLENKDKILALTKGVFEAFSKETIVQDLAKTAKLKEIKKIFRKNEKSLREIYGACLLILLKKEGFLQKRIYLPKMPLFIPKLLQRIFPQSPNLQQKFSAGLICITILSLLLILGYFIFK